ncbi:hypothetical protein [Psychroflexus aestuariivivens]|uniref:hypothetical protein n=1 Tax=Psychroflexus aestuariivivens TaxID=1795040 RepID=UPI000FD85736|nr:hypothetical protein [Psychroflexus aestuariivivens]
MKIDNLIFTKLKQIYDSHFGENGKYKEIRHIDTPEKSLNRVGGDDDHYSFHISDKCSKYSEKVEEIVGDLNNKLSTCFSFEEEIKLFQDIYKDCSYNIMKNTLYNPKKELQDQINFNHNDLLKLLINLFVNADMQRSRSYYNDKEINNVKPSEVCNLTIIFWNFEWYHKTNTEVFEDYLFNFIRLKIVFDLLEEKTDTTYLLYFNNHFGYKVLKLFSKVYDKNVGPSVLLSLRKLFEKEYYKKEPLGRKTSKEKDYLKVVNPVFDKQIKSLRSIDESKDKSVKQIFKKCIKHCNTRI